MNPYYGGTPDIIVFALVTYLVTQQLTKKGVFLLHESYEFVVIRIIFPLFVSDSQNYGDCINEFIY
jgi:hypothetical protein